MVLPHESFTEENIFQRLQSLLWFEPTEVLMMSRGVTVPYRTESIHHVLRNEMKNSRFTFRIADSDEHKNYVSFTKLRYHSHISLLFDGEHVEVSDIIERLDKLVVNLDAITAFGMSRDDFFWQNNQDPKYYKKHNKPLSDVKIIPDPILTNRQRVDLRSLPGSVGYFQEIPFTSSWTMWFGPSFFNYVSFEMLMAYEGFWQKEILDRTCVRVSLYEHPWEYELPENRELQWRFKRYMNWDKIVEGLKTSGEASTASDPAIEFLTTQLAYGGDIRVNYYYNDDRQLVPRSQATMVEAYELQKNGVVVWSNITKL